MRIYLESDHTFLWQWQPKEHIVLEGYPDGVFVHYANCNTAEAPVVQSRRVGDKLIADIPPELMQEALDITVYVCDEDGTRHCHFLPVLSRPKPESYVTEPVEILRYESLAKRIATLEEGGVGGVALDTTLTQSGKAADAKAVGDALSELEGKIPTKPEDVGALPSTYTPPDQTAEQVGADPKGTAASAVSAHNISGDAHNDIRLEVKAIREQLSAFLDVDEETLNELSELIAAIAANQTSIAQLTSGKVSISDIIDNLTTNVANKPLSAAQGVALKVLIDELGTAKLDASALPEAIKTALAQAKATGEFDGEDGITPHIGGNGNWFTGSTDTGVPATGPQGETGVSGVYTLGEGESLEDAPEDADVVIDPGGAPTMETWVFTLADGTTVEKQVYVYAV